MIFNIDDYVIYTLVNTHYIVEGIILDVDNDRDILTIVDNNGKKYRDYMYMFKLDVSKNRNNKIEKILC